MLCATSLPGFWSGISGGGQPHVKASCKYRNEVTPSSPVFGAITWCEVRYTSHRLSWARVTSLVYLAVYEVQLFGADGRCSFRQLRLVLRLFFFR
jgi:hypothetical protein